MNDVARRIGDLPPEKLELLMKRLVKRQVEHPQSQANTRISVSRVRPAHCPCRSRSGDSGF